MQQQIYTNIYLKNKAIQKYFKTLNDFKNKFIVQSGGTNLKIKYNNHKYVFKKNKYNHNILKYIELTNNNSIIEATKKY